MKLDSLKRNSNIELLRIITILIIILSHFNFFSGFQEVNVGNYSINSFFNRFFLFGIVGNNLFIIITGYFMHNKEQLNISKYVKLAIKTFNYSILILICFCLFGKVSIINIIKSFFPLFFGNWFIIYYLLLMLFVPFINKFIKMLNEFELKKVIVLMLIVFSIIPTFSANIWNYTYHDLFIVDYLIGAYIAMYCKDKYKSQKRILLGIFLMLTIYLLSILFFIGIGIIFNKNVFIEKCHYLITNFSIYNVILAIFVFLLFRNLKMKNYKIINYISKSVLGIYLIHENFLVRDWLWKKFIPLIDFYNSHYFILLGIGKVLLVFILCLAIDIIYNILFENFEDKLSKKMVLFFNKLNVKR